MNSDITDMFANDCENSFVDDIYSLYNLDDGKNCDSVIFPPSFTGERDEGKKEDKQVESDEKKKLEAEMSEKMKPKINVLSHEETKTIFNEKVKNDNIDLFIKTFKQKRYKKKQPDGVTWNEVTKDFEKSPDMIVIDKEIRNLDNDKASEIKNFYAKNLSKEISEKIKRNPEKSKEILTQFAEKKLDPAEALKGYNKELFKEVSDNNKFIDRSRERPVQAKNYDKYDNSKDRPVQAKNYDNYNDNSKDRPVHAKNYDNYNDSSKDRRGPVKDNDRRRFYNNNDQYKKSPNDFPKDSYRDAKERDGKSREERKYRGYSSSRDVNNNKNSKDSYSYGRKISYNQSPIINRNRNQRNDRGNYNRGNNFERNSKEIRKLSYDNTQNSSYSRRDDRSEGRKNQSDISRSKSSDCNRSNVFQDTSYNKSNAEKGYIEKKKIDAPRVINIATPESNYIRKDNHIDLTNDDAECYIPPESEHVKRKKLHEEMNDVVVNLKVDNINYILNNPSNPGDRQIELSLEELTMKLKNDLKLVSYGDTFAQMLKCFSYMENQLNVDTINVIPEYLSFRDKSISIDKDALVNALFYFMFVHKSIVKSSMRNKVDLKILQDNPLVMNSERSWKSKSFATNSRQTEPNNNLKNRNLQNYNNDNDYEYDISQNVTKINSNPRDKMPRKNSEYIPDHSNKEEEVVMSGRINKVEKTNLDVGTMLFGGIEKSNMINEPRNFKTEQSKSLNPKDWDDRSRSKSPLPRPRNEMDVDDGNLRDRSMDHSRSKSPLPRKRSDIEVDDRNLRDKSMDRSRSKSPLPLPRARNEIDTDDRRKRDKSVDHAPSKKEKNIESKVASVHAAVEEKVFSFVGNNLNLNSDYGSCTLNEILNKQGKEKDRERDRSKSFLKVAETRPLENKKEFLNRKRSNEEKDDLNSSLNNALKTKKKLKKQNDSLPTIDKNDFSDIDDEVPIKTKKSKNKKEENEKRNEVIPSKTKENTKNSSKSSFETRLKDMIDRDEKYNIIMKYAHKITDPDNWKNLQTLIPKKEDIDKIENVLNGKKKEDISAALFENDLIKIYIRFFNSGNNFSISRVLKNEKK